MSGNNLLSDSACKLVEAKAEQILTYKSKIEECVNIFETLINDSTVSSWLKDTENGIASAQKVSHNNESLLALAKKIEVIHNYSMMLVRASRAANMMK